MGEEKADVAILDAPYNRPSEQIGGRGRTKHGNFLMGSGELSNAEFVKFLHKTHSNVAHFSRDGALHYSFMDWRGIRWLIEAMDPIYGAMLNMGVWVKSTPGQGSFLRSQHELVAIYRVGEAAHLNNIQLGKFGRSRSNVWQCPGANTFRKGRLEDLADHPTIKPVRLYAEILKDCTRPQNIALDCFGGSGTLLLASEQVGRRARVMELDPKYADVTIRRWQKYTGRDAVHIDANITFDELAEIRSRPVRTRTRFAR
jgi:DNA methylase